MLMLCIDGHVLHPYTLRQAFQSCVVVGILTGPFICSRRWMLEVFLGGFLLIHKYSSDAH